MKPRFLFLILSLTALLLSCSQDPKTFQIKRDRVREGSYTAKAVNPGKMTSNYPLQSHPGLEQPIIFKLSLNGHDNEGGIGQDHYLVIPDGVSEFYAPAMRFGEGLPRPQGPAPRIEKQVNAHFRVDLRPVLHSFETRGYYVTSTADTIRATEFRGLFMAGNTPPLHWIWDTQTLPSALQFEDQNADSIYELTIHFEPPGMLHEKRVWELQADLSPYPHFASPDAPLLEAITNLAMEEALLNIRPDGAFSAGKEWPGVWTRDVAYATQLSLAYLFPEHAKTSLRHKLSPAGRIIQDTGTGGAWPVSSDRFTWVLAAWEVFLATGDQAWLDEIRDPVIHALQEDILWNRDPVSGMLLGETSFEDWREQTYPAWMSPADIHASHALSTNILFKRALEIGLVLAEKNQQITASWPGLIKRLDANIIAHFWDQELEAPSAYMICAPAWQAAAHRDLLGESLGILYSASFASVSTKLTESYPRTAYGSPVISHQLPDIPPYHNQAIWPFVEAYALLAAKAAHNQVAYQHSFAALTRAAAMFLSHRENFHDITGAPDQTAINSDRQLWSVGAWLAAIYKGLFGMEISYAFDDRSFELTLHPDNPFPWDGYALDGLVLHDTPISIKLNGVGSIVQALRVNGELLSPETSLKLTGEPLDIEIELTNADDPGKMIQAEFMQPATPVAHWSVDTLSWSNPSGTTLLELNGRILDTLRSSPVIMPDTLTGFFALRTLAADGLVSLPTDPQYLGASATLILTAQEPYFVELGKETGYIRLGFSLPVAGNYLLRFIYANGSGPINTGNTCGLAKLTINDWWLEQMISFPHTESWDNWQATAWAKAYFKAGNNSIELNQDTLPVTNMNGRINLFRVAKVEIIPVSQ